ncbi:MAG: PASTA domain-containing protein [Chitinivibrionales bacterium]|nr:PASTA domain-containing protein [Chitinivibrionales bacterium]
MKKNYTINVSIPSFTFWRIFIPGLLLCIIIGSFVGIVIIDQIIMPRLPGVQNKGAVKVPSIVKQSYEQARQSLYNIGLRLEVQEREYSDSIDKDIVLHQEPAAGQTVKRGRHILVIVSKGSEVSTIPDVRRMNERAGRGALRDAGFTNIKIYRAFNDNVEKDQIINTNPGRGTTISREVPVEVVLSKGGKPTHAQVPNLVGDLVSEAKRKIEEAGLSVGALEYKVTQSGKPGCIISQSVSPGSNAPLETPINLIISSSKESQ